MGVHKILICHCCAHFCVSENIFHVADFCKMTVPSFSMKLNAHDMHIIPNFMAIGYLM